MRILGIETSCDDTGIAIYDQKKGLLTNELYNQSKIHTNYGGIVPELASRNHIYKTSILIKKVLNKIKQKSIKIDGVAYTAGPGLIGSLIVGASIACALAYALHIPIIPINHMEGHLLSVMMKKNKPCFPFIALLVSGAHTQLIAATDIGKYKLLGKSIDDSVGEAFDKTAKLLGLEYPGGPLIENLAKYGKTGYYYFTRPMIKGLNFSFSGLKTAVAKTIRYTNNSFQNKANIARAFQDAIIDTLIIKSQKALKLTGFRKLIIAGGVSANKNLRNNMDSKIKKKKHNVYYPKQIFCTDNGAMIAYAGIKRWNNRIQNNLKIKIEPNWNIEDLSPLDQ